MTNEVSIHHSSDFFKTAGASHRPTSYGSSWAPTPTFSLPVENRVFYGRRGTALAVDEVFEVIIELTIVTPINAALFKIILPVCR